MPRLTLPAVLAGLLLAAVPAAALELPSPAEQRAQDIALLREVGARADRILVSVVPGPVVNDEVVLVGLSGAGVPQQVLVEQRLRLTGSGDYQVRERGPARAAVALGEEPPPVTKFGAVVWQGFSPGRRELAARLTLDPVLEGPRLPLAVALSWRGPDGRTAPLGPQGRVPGAGTITVRLTNRSTQPAELPTGADADARAVAAALDTARRATPGARLPAAGAGLPPAVEAREPAAVRGSQAVPLRVTGTLLLDGATVTGPATTAVPGGARLAGTLADTVEFTVAAPGPGTLRLDLTVVPVLDARTLVPPGGAATWAAWAARGPDAAARRAALDLLVQVAATGARASSYSPYLGADLPGTGTTAFRYAFAPAEAVEAVRAPLEPQPRAIALAGLAALLVLGTGAGIWRLS